MEWYPASRGGDLQRYGMHIVADETEANMNISVRVSLQMEGGWFALKDDWLVKQWMLWSARYA